MVRVGVIHLHPYITFATLLQLLHLLQLLQLLHLLQLLQLLQLLHGVADVAGVTPVLRFTLLRKRKVCEKEKVYLRWLGAAMRSAH